MDNYFINPVDTKGWELVAEGSKDPIKAAKTKAEILRATAEYMKGKTGSVKVRKRNGTFSEERTYPRSADPRRSKG